jgi:EAL domain
MADPPRTVDVLRGLREIGVAVSLDDFGAGHSSLAHVKQLSVEKLKIDQSFVAGMADSPQDAAIVRSAVDLAPGPPVRHRRGRRDTRRLGAAGRLRVRPSAGVIRGAPDVGGDAGRVAAYDRQTDDDWCARRALARQPTYRQPGQSIQQG